MTITNPKGEIAVKERTTGRIYANGYMIYHQKWDFWWYTHRDLFWVLDGDLVIYGGEFQAGRQKDQAKSNFTWGNLKTVIGDAVAFGTSVFEYASGITAAEAARSDLMGGDSKENKAETGKNAKPSKKDPTDSQIAEANKAIGAAYPDCGSGQRAGRVYPQQTGGHQISGCFRDLRRGRGPLRESG